jgi:hypothetical protein
VSVDLWAPVDRAAIDAEAERLAAFHAAPD